MSLAAAARVAPAQPTSKNVRAPSKCVTDGAPIRGGRTIFPELRALGTRVWSGGLSWAATAPTRPAEATSPDDPAYRWPASITRAVSEARANRIEPILNVSDFPSWANGGRSGDWAPERPEDFADFMAAAVLKYPQVRRWIVISEPGAWPNFRPQGGNGRTAPHLYSRLLDAAYAAMHAVRPGVVVIGGGVHPSGRNDQYTTAPDTFIANMVLPNGRRPRLDMFAINPYTERRLDLALPKRPLRVDFDDLDWLARRLDKLWPRRRLRIFIDEFGWNTEHEALGWLYYVPRKKQAASLRKAYALASKFGRVDTMCWYQLYDAPPRRNSTQWLNWTSGLRTWDGVRKPSWKMFARVPRGPRPDEYQTRSLISKYDRVWGFFAQSKRPVASPVDSYSGAFGVARTRIVAADSRAAGVAETCVQACDSRRAGWAITPHQIR